MNKKHILLSAALVSLATMQAQTWPKASPEARPYARWWWLGSAVDAKNLTWNLEEYSKAGLGGLEITPIYGVKGNDNHELKYLSTPWMKMLAHTQNEAKRLGMQIDMNNGTGWPFGGPEVSYDDAATAVFFETYEGEGGKSLDIVVRCTEKKQENAKLSRLMAYNGNEVIDLTSKVGADGKTHLDLPKSKERQWKLVALFVGKTHQAVKRAAPGGEGLVIDHFSKSAVSHYLDKFDKAFKNSETEFPHNMFNDSYEVYHADWTPSLLEEFQLRRGYRLEDHLLDFLRSSKEERTDKSARIIADYRETLSDLLLENFTAQWTSWAHRHGSLTRNQAHGSPANLIDTYAGVDIPECEGFGLSNFGIKGLRVDTLSKKNFSDLSMLKYASSAAHISGKNLTSSETFTWLTEHFRTSLSQCKPDMDLMFVSGINHMFFHGTTYSPQDDPWPGWKFYASIDMSPTNSIWRDAPYFFNYITRCQSFLQMGKPDNDFLVYLPIYDMWKELPGRMVQFDIHSMAKRAPRFIEAINKINQSGYDVDYLSDKFIMSLTFSNGHLVTSGGTAYKALVLPGVNVIPNNVLDHIIKLAKAGAKIVFLDKYPDDVPGFYQFDIRRQELQSLIASLPSGADFKTSLNKPFGKGSIITGSDYASTLALCGVNAEEMKSRFGLQEIRRQNSTGHHYFISSLQDKGVDSWVTLGVNAADAYLFDPMTGNIGKALIRQQGGKTQVYLQLASGESVILQTFRKAQKNKLPKWLYREKSLYTRTPTGWTTLTFKESTPKVEGKFRIDSPKSWTELGNDSANITMGTGVYSFDYNIPSFEADDWVLNLGDVRESARVIINGKDAGCLWAVPYEMRIGKYLVEGKNHFDIEVTNLPANRISHLDRQGVEWRKFKEINIVDVNYKRTKYDYWKPEPSGLCSKVTLTPIFNKKF